MTSITVRGLYKILGGKEILAGTDFTVQPGEFLTLLGSSGCGKSTTLKCIAGLESPDGGEIYLGDRLLASANFSMPTSKRGVGMVFQSYALWPHMTAAENVGFPLRVRRQPAAAAKKRVQEVLELVGLGNVAGRYPSQLSGGQQQRVALARSLVYEPEVILLDEPLSNLDAKLRNEMRKELVRIQRESGTTTIYVTHDRAEALSMSDRVCIMKDGKILQNDAPAVVWNNPTDPYVAEFLESGALIRCTVRETGVGGGPVRVQVGDTVIEAIDANPGNLVKGAPATVVVQTEGVEIGSGSTDARLPNELPGTIVSVSPVGPRTEVELTVAGSAPVTKSIEGAAALEWSGHRASRSPITVRFASASARVFPSTVEDAA